MQSNQATNLLVMAQVLRTPVVAVTVTPDNVGALRTITRRTKQLAAQIIAGEYPVLRNSWVYGEPQPYEDPTAYLQFFGLRG